MNRIMKKLVPGVLAAALALGAVPSGITIDDIIAKADGDPVVVPTERRVQTYGASIGAAIGSKLMFTVDDEVASIGIVDPDYTDGRETKYNLSQANSNKYLTKDDNGTYTIRTDIYPKNMDKNIEFRMYNSNGEALNFYFAQNATYTKESYSYSMNTYLNALQPEVGTAFSNTATKQEKALYDICFALKNYGEWSKFYFANKNKALNQIDYDKRPTSATPYSGSGSWAQGWWTTPAKHWASDLGLTPSVNEQGETVYPSFDAVLSGIITADSTPQVDHKGGTTGEPTELQERPYSATLILDETVKMRVYFSAIVDFLGINGNPASLYNVKQASAVTNYVDTAPIELGHLKDIKIFLFDGNYTSDEVLIDKVQGSPAGFIKQIVIDQINYESNKHEKTGLSNTLRALITVEAAMYNYQEAYATDATE